LIKVIVASSNPVKLQAIKLGFQQMFPDQEFLVEKLDSVPGTISQPRGDQETLQCAYDRMERAAKLAPLADFWAGVEGGIEDQGLQMSAFAWIVIKSGKKVGKGRTGTFYLPQSVANLVRQGRELGEADDIVFRRVNSKQADGAIGILTNNVVNRTQLYEQAVILALIPFKNLDLY
jgi:inosine/xanthosine triphosphatase